MRPPCAVTRRLGALALLLAVIAVAAEPCSAEGPCSGRAYETARSLVGSWDEFTVTDEGEVPLGRLETRFEAGGCGLAQRFEAADGSFSFASIGYVDGVSGWWKEIFVFSFGRVVEYAWRPDGDDLLLERTGGDGASERRLRVRDLERDAYEVVDERSTDGGATWQAEGLTRTRRVKDDR